MNRTFLNKNQIPVIVALLLAGSWVAFTFEQRMAEHRYRSRASALPIPEDDIGEHDYDGRLVVVAGLPRAAGIVSDPDFGVTLNTLRLQRQVEMYQWVEREYRRKETGVDGDRAGSGTDYEYEPEWSEHVWDSQVFHHPEKGLRNPNSLPYPSREFIAEGVRLGSFALPERLVHEIPTSQIFMDMDVARFPAVYLNGGGGRLRDGYFYVKGFSDPPRIGDIRVAFRFAPPTEVTIIAEKQGFTFTPHQTPAGLEIEQVAVGRQPANALLSPPYTIWKERVGVSLALFVLTAALASLFVSGWPAWPQWIGVAALAAGLYGIAAGLAWKPYFPNIGWYALPAGALLTIIGPVGMYALRRRAQAGQRG